jgi:excisionase family DNA binding protein
MPVITRDRLLSVKQVAELFNVREQYVYRLTYSGRLPRKYVGRHVRIYESDARAFIKDDR